MGRSTLVAGSIALALALALPAAARAQRTRDIAPSLVEQYEITFAKLTIDFWTPLLNQYRGEIDRMLSAPDLIELRELRVHTALLLERMKRLSDRQKANRPVVRLYDNYVDDDTSSPAVGEDDGGIDAPLSTQDAATYDSLLALATAYGSPGPSDSAEYVDDDDDKYEPGFDYEAYEREREKALELQQEERNREELRILELVLGDENAAGLLDEQSGFSFGDSATFARNGMSFSDIQESQTIWNQRSEIRQVAEWIARNYRSAMEELRARYDADVERYHEAIRISAREFYRKHREAVNGDEMAVRRMLISLDRSPDDRYIGDQPPPMAFLYSPPLEAALLLYNGQDLRDLMLVEDLMLVSSVGFEKLPPSSTLGENSPSPASARTIIPYTLAAPARQVVLQVVDTRGTVVATFDQGARDRGEHRIDIDVTTLPAGTYLYELRVTNDSGERLYSRSMSVQN